MAKNQGIGIVFIIILLMIPIASATEFIYPYYYDLNQGGFTETFVMGDNYFKSSSLEFLCKDQYARSSGYVSVSETPKTCWRATTEFKDKGTIETYNLNPDDEIQLNKYMKVKYTAEGKVYYGTDRICKDLNFGTTKPPEISCNDVVYYGELRELSDFKNYFTFTITDTSFLSSSIAETDTLLKITQDKTLPLIIYNDFANNIEGGSYVYFRTSLVFGEESKNVDFPFKLGNNVYDKIQVKTDELKTTMVATQPYIYLKVPRYNTFKVFEEKFSNISYYVVPNIDLTVSTSIKCFSSLECREGYYCGGVTYKNENYNICLNKQLYTPVPSPTIVKDEQNWNYGLLVVFGIVIAFGLLALLLRKNG